ncbi:MAG: hypothetical protein ACJ8G2_11875 [Burkholderiales bacterium]
MKYPSSLILLLMGFAGLFGYCGLVCAVDPLQADSGHHRLEFEKDYFRVDRGFFGPGEIAADFFDAEGVVIVALTPMRMRLHLPDGKFVDTPPAPAGAAFWAPPGRIRPQNLLDQPVEFIIVLPRGATAASARGGADPLNVDPEHWKLEVENETVRALRYRGDPHGRGVMHGHPAHVVVFLTNAKTLVHKPAASSLYTVDKAGSVINVSAGEHAPENLFDEPVETIVVERK